MSLLVECLTEQKCFHIRFKSSKLSVTVRGREFQVARAEQRKARLPKAVLEKGSDSAVVEDERRVRRMSRDLMLVIIKDPMHFVIR